MKRKLNTSLFEERTAKRNQLSEIDTLGTYDFATSVIYLKSLKATDFEYAKKITANFSPSWNNGSPNLFSGEQYSALAKVQPLAVHEYTHFIDGTSTLWGLRHLQLMNDAYISKNEGEENFYKAKIFDDHIRNFRLPSYYTEIHNKPNNSQPWRSTITIGRVFDKNGFISKKSILFSRFANFDGDNLVRSPVSTISILEASAMAQEIMHHANLLKLTDADYRLIEERDFSKKHIEFLYTRHLTEYSVCIHILANKLNCSDSLIAFSMCAELTRIALNFPLVLFEELYKVCPVEKILNIKDNHPFAQAIRDGLRSYDLGTIYYLLCQALPNNVIESKELFNNGIAVAIRTLGIDVGRLTHESNSEAQSLKNTLQTTKINYIKILSQAGYENYKTIKKNKDKLDFTKLNIPPSLLGDDTIILPFLGEKNSLAKLNVEECFFELDDGKTWVRKFSESCL